MKQKSRKKNFLSENFHFFGPIFEGRATFKEMIHPTRRIAEVESGTGLFSRPRATILAILNVYGKRWHLVVNLLKERLKTTPPSGQIVWSLVHVTLYYPQYMIVSLSRRPKSHWECLRTKSQNYRLSFIGSLTFPWQMIIFAIIISNIPLNRMLYHLLMLTSPTS